MGWTDQGIDWQGPDWKGFRVPMYRRGAEMTEQAKTLLEWADQLQGWVESELRGWPVPGAGDGEDGALKRCWEDRRGLEDAGVKERLEGLRGKGIMGWLVEGDE